MKRVVLVTAVSVLVLASIACASTISNVRGHQVTTSNGQVKFIVTNSSRLPITALAVTATKTPADGGRAGRSVRMFDSVVNPFGPFGRAIAPGESHTFSLAGPLEKRKIEATIEAVIFADGSSAGDPHWVQRLVHARQAELNDVEDALRLTRAAKASSVDVATLASEVQGRKDAVVGSSSASVDEKQVAQMVYGEVALRMKAQTPSAQRFDAAISQLTTRRNLLLSSRPTLTDNMP